MNPLRRSSLVAVAIVAYCAWQARDIVGAWRHAPFDRLGWLSLLIWAFPLAWIWRREFQKNHAVGSATVLVAGLGISLLGTLGEVNALCYLGLACALAGTVSWSWVLLPWLIAGVAWMPVFGYLVSRGAAGLILPGRLLLALAAALWLWKYKLGRPAQT